MEGDLLGDLISAADSLSNEKKPPNGLKNASVKEINIFDRNESKVRDTVASTSSIKDTGSVVHTGLSDSSDDEDNKYFEETKYNVYGRDIKKLVNTRKEKLEPKNTGEKWTLKPSTTDTKQLSAPPSKNVITKDSFVDPFFGIRIVNPLVSSKVLQERMVGRESVSLAKLKWYIQKLTPDKDWVIGAVVVQKSASKTSQKGNQFSIWSLSDLHGDLKTVSVFLFGKAYQELWKTAVGTVVGILNPNILDKKDGSKDEVCRRFNHLGSKYLSRGFIQTEKRHSSIYKRVKSLLPRRESERRTHPLARHCDILSAVETRISMLNMTFSKYIDSNLCCFIPGKVIDEIARVLRVIENKGPPPRTHELLQELRDISSMAMEHFEEQILPNLKLQIEQPPIIPLLPQVSSKSSKFVLVECAIADEVRKMKKQHKTQKIQLVMFTKQMQKVCRKVKRQNLKLKSQAIKIREQERKIQEQSAKMQEQETTIADLRKHMDEWEQKFSDLTAEVRAKDDYITKTNPAQQLSSLPSLSTKFHLSNIKPRKAQILPKAFSTIHAELDRKRKCPASFEIPNKLSRNSSSCMGSETASVIDELSQYPGVSAKVTDTESRGLLSKSKSDIGTFTSNVIGTLLSNPIASIKSRKRKMTEDIELK